MLIKLVPVSKAGDVTIFAIPNTKVMVALSEEDMASFPNYDIVLEQYSAMLSDLTRTPKTPQVPLQGPPQARTTQHTEPMPTQAPGQSTPQETVPQAPKPLPQTTPEAPPADSKLMSKKWLGDNVDTAHLPFRVNDDAVSTEKISVQVAQEIADNWDSLTESDRMKLARKIARIKIHARMKVKDLLPQELRGMVVSISANKDGANSSFIPASEQSFLGVDPPDFGLNKSAPLANIPEEFDQAARGKGPTTEYRSVESLESMLKGD